MKERNAVIKGLTIIHYYVIEHQYDKKSISALETMSVQEKSVGNHW